MTPAPIARVKSSRGESPIVLAPGALRDPAAGFVALLPDRRRPLAIVTDENVERAHAARFVAALRREGTPIAATIVLPLGERGKNHRALEFLHHRLADSGLARDGIVVAVGGGVVGDLAGFAAATWNRGVDWIVAPTTLLAQVDAAIGGKTGIDLPHGKNLVGAFWPPLAVLVDPEALATLDPREIRSGRGELLKYALLSGADRLDRFAAISDADFARAAPEALAAIEHAIVTKADLCSRDEFDRAERRALNAGHTIGHALETAGGYSELSHGEAVAIGLIAEARLAVECAGGAEDLPERIASVCRAVGLRDRAPGDRSFLERALAALALDKKRGGRALVFALPCAAGDIRIVELDPLRFGAPIARAVASAIESSASP